MDRFNYCHHPAAHGRTCALSELILVADLEATDTEQARYQTRIYRCQVCQGLYKYLYQAHYETRMMDRDAGWLVLCDRYYKIEEERANVPPLTIAEARSYGYQGPDATWSDGRCNYELTPSGLSCRFTTLARVESLPGLIHPSTVYRCTRCGQLYKQVWQTSARFQFVRPGETADGGIAFPPEEAAHYAALSDDQVSR